MNENNTLHNRPIPLREAVRLLPEDVQYKYDTIRSWVLSFTLKHSVSRVKKPGNKNASLYARPRDLVEELRGFVLENSKPSPKVMRALAPHIRKAFEKGGKA